MTSILLPLFLLFPLGILFYLLYINGFLTISTKSALLFIGTIRGKNNQSKATFSSCNGSIKRVIRFKESKVYHPVLHQEISKGNLTINLLDSSKQTLLTLDNNRKNGQITIDKKKRYYLVFHFDSASGHFELNWEK